MEAWIWSILSFTECLLPVSYVLATVRTVVNKCHVPALTEHYWSETADMEADKQGEWRSASVDQSFGAKEGDGTVRDTRTSDGGFSMHGSHELTLEL